MARRLEPFASGVLSLRRAEAGISLSRLAAEVGVSVRQIVYYECGRHSPPPPGEVEAPSYLKPDRFRDADSFDDPCRRGAESQRSASGHMSDSGVRRTVLGLGWLSGVRCLSLELSGADGPIMTTVTEGQAFRVWGEVMAASIAPSPAAAALRLGYGDGRRQDVWRILHILPVAVPEEALAVFAEQIPESIVDPQVIVEFRAPSAGPSNMIDSAYERVLADAAVLAVGAGAEADGFAAVVINSMSDSALRALRSRLSIPVVGACETAFMYAAQLGKRLGVVTMWPPWRDLYAPVAAGAGLADRLVSVRDIGIRPDAEELLTGKEHVVFPLLEEACRAAIDEDGAEVLILGSTTMHQSHRFLSDRLEVPVINPGVVAHQFAQTLLRSGLTHSRRTHRSPAVPADSLLTNAFTGPGHS